MIRQWLHILVSMTLNACFCESWKNNYLWHFNRLYFTFVTDKCILLILERKSKTKTKTKTKTKKNYYIVFNKWVLSLFLLLFSNMASNLIHSGTDSMSGLLKLCGAVYWAICFPYRARPSLFGFRYHIHRPGLKLPLDCVTYKN